MYGLESDIYSIFDLISSTFQRITFTPIRNKSLSSVSLLSSIIHPSPLIQNNLLESPCSYQPYDDICITTSDTNSIALLYPNITLHSSLSLNATIKPLMKTILTSTLLSITIDSSSTSTYAIINRTFSSNSYIEKFNWKNAIIFTVPTLIGIILCVSLATCACVKYRRKDAGVYELEETQRFRPLIIELTPSPGETSQQILNSTKNMIKKTNIKSHKRRKRKDSLLLRTDEQREFYI